jgi:micrococcal nuclease
MDRAVSRPSIGVTIGLVFCLVVVASFVGRLLGEAHRNAASPWRVTHTDDGDTIEVQRGSDTDVIRFLGVDTPETHHPTKPVQCFGPEAAAFTKRELTGRLVVLEDDVEHRDLYGRRLAYVLVDGQRFNDVLLRLGYARLLVIAPNRAHGRELLDAELDARHHHRGLWAECE